MKRQSILLFLLILLVYPPSIFPNPGDEQFSLCVVFPSLPNSPRTTINDISPSNNVTGPLSNEQILNSLKQLNKFCAETGAKKEEFKTAVTITLLQPK
jgi:hypothetical protein